ncbi:hypothetical protein B0H13DRAFT_2659680 [Mycena leptocephala]|nr:hypothetical protein B0H13DRAFT_2659680 [Mycena leptocephala]
MSAPPTLPPFGTIIDVKLIYGPLLLGVFFNMILFGILVAQMLTYFQSARRDPLFMRIFIYGVFFVEVANTAFDIAIMFQLLVLEYAAIPDKLPTVFMTGTTSLSMLRIHANSVMCSAYLCCKNFSIPRDHSSRWFQILVAFPCQLFFIWRIHTFTKSKILCGFIIALALTTLGVGMWAVYHLIRAGRWSNIPSAHQAAEVWLFFSAATDLVIAVCLALALKGKKTGMAVTDTIVDRIIRMTIQTGVLTALFNVLDVVFFLTIKNATFNFMVNLPLSKLYSNCLMSALNAREQYNRTLNDAVNGMTTAASTMSAPVYSPNSKAGADTFDFGTKTGALDEEYLGGNTIMMTAY